MNSPRSPLVRDVVGLFLGGIASATVAALVMLAFVSLPKDPRPYDHTREVLGLLLLVTFLCGGFVGRKAFNVDYWSEVLPTVIGCYVVMIFLGVVSSVDFLVSATLIGFATPGIVSSAVVMRVLCRWLPPPVSPPHF
jgi:hypothetical protein